MYRRYYLLIVLFLIAATGRADAKISTIQLAVPTDSCSDSDSGLKFYRQGMVIDAQGTSFQDTCISPETLVEYTCDSVGSAEIIEQNCPNGCQLGACVGPNVIVIGWDAAQRDHLLECFNKESPECLDGLPNLAALSGGVIYDSVTTSGTSQTKPGWAQIFSGYNAETIGVYSNTDFHPIPYGFTVFEKAEDYFGADNLVTLFLSGKDTETGGECSRYPSLGILETEKFQEGYPWCFTKDSLNHFESKKSDNQFMAKKAMSLLEDYQNDLILATFIFWDPDAAGHLYGENSPEYSLSLVNLDTWLGLVVGKLDQLGILDRTMIYVMSDHGFGEDATRHVNAPYGFLASNDPSISRSGDRKDFAPTLLEGLGISREAIGDAPAVEGFSLYSPVPFSCVSEGGAFIDYPGAPACCTGLDLISFEAMKNGKCIEPSGAAGNLSGYCTQCGDGICSTNENICNCRSDCPLQKIHLTPVFNTLSVR